MASISKITINGFKAFPKEFNLNLDGKNLLMYGENGSGKSSIYYALHALLQSQCHEIQKYFNKNSDECIVNTMTATPVPKVSVKFENSDITYNISENGYEESIQQPTSPIKDLNGKCVFINHKFLFNFFSFRNSQYIDLFPVFIKDILPFTLTKTKSKFISQVYDEVKNGIQRKGNSTHITVDYKNKIEEFNNEVKTVIDHINVNSPSGTASKIYNSYFINEGDLKLKIELIYDNSLDEIPQIDKSYWLRLGYRYIKESKAGVGRLVKKSNSLEILEPVIRLRISEILLDGSLRYISKPQSYFNEAKLTAIVLSIRFSLLDTITAQDGRFLALDDMLISLDMSNRMKVIRYLLDEVADKYKIYLFTHDRLFYHTLKRIIETQYSKDEWNFGGLYLNDLDSPLKPEFMPETTSKIKDAHEAYKRHDYFRCGTLLRQLCEQCLKELLPDSYRIIENIQTGLTENKSLDQQILSLEEFCCKEKIDYAPFKDLKIYKDLFMNATAHNDITSPFYRNEIKRCLHAIEVLSQIKRSESINCKKDLSFSVVDSTNKKYTVRIRRRDDLKFIEYNGNKKLSYFCKCTVKKIISNLGDENVDEGFDSIYQAYNYICNKLQIQDKKSLLDILEDKSGLIIS